MQKQVAQQIVKPAEIKEVVALTGCDLVRSEASKYSGWDVNVMVAIARAESGCNPNATGDTSLTYSVNGRTYGYSVGVFQVRILEGREDCDTHAVATNVACAYRIWQGQGYRAWSVFLNNKYLQFI